MVILLSQKKSKKKFSFSDQVSPYSIPNWGHLNGMKKVLLPTLTHTHKCSLAAFEWQNFLLGLCTLCCSLRCIWLLAAFAYATLCQPIQRSQPAAMDQISQVGMPSAVEGELSIACIIQPFVFLFRSHSQTIHVDTNSSPLGCCLRCCIVCVPFTIHYFGAQALLIWFVCRLYCH